ncbi:MAG: hypothetical protein M3Y32_04280 [Pseudomonadota bacterium]|nr:hypothetical protein [Pseudomonadota bacterium]
MNAIAPNPSECRCLVEIIELKWLLTAHGVPLHVERLQADREYALATLARAAALPGAGLQATAARLRSLLGFDADGSA